MSDDNESIEINEKWADISGFNGEYQISTYGRVKSIKNGSSKILRGCINKQNGYIYIGLCKDGSVTRTTIHRLVAEAFIQNPHNLPCVNHKDENKENNNVDNLEWCSYQYNLTYGTHTDRAKETRKKNGTDTLLYEYSIKNRTYITQRTREVKGKRVVKIDKYTGEILKTYDTIRDAEIENNCKHISECVRNIRNESGGYIWQTIEDIENDENCIVNAVNRIKLVSKQCKKTMNEGMVIVQYDMSDNVINEFNSIKEASELTGCGTSGISACIHNRQKTSNGYVWKLKEQHI